MLLLLLLLLYGCCFNIDVFVCTLLWLRVPKCIVAYDKNVANFPCLLDIKKKKMFNAQFSATSHNLTVAFGDCAKKTP